LTNEEKLASGLLICLVLVVLMILCFDDSDGGPDVPVGGA
jgi:hypothetical protein